MGQAGQPAVCRHPFKTFNRSVKLIVYLPCLVIVCFGNVRAFFSGIENNSLLTSLTQIGELARRLREQQRLSQSPFPVSAG